MAYGYRVRLPEPFTPTLVERVVAALGQQGFGVLSRIDVRATLRDKLGEDMEDYLILGACNPLLAHQALQADADIGLLLPCNVLIRGDGPDTTVVQAVDPQMMVRVTDRPGLRPVADEAANRLQAALHALTG